MKCGSSERSVLRRAGGGAIRGIAAGAGVGEATTMTMMSMTIATDASGGTTIRVDGWLTVIIERLDTIETLKALRKTGIK